MTKEPKYRLMFNWQAFRAAALIGVVAAAFVCFVIARTEIGLGATISISVGAFFGVVGALEY